MRHRTWSAFCTVGDGTGVCRHGRQALYSLNSSPGPMTLFLTESKIKLNNPICPTSCPTWLPLDLQNVLASDAKQSTVAVTRYFLWVTLTKDDSPSIRMPLKALPATSASWCLQSILGCSLASRAGPPFSSLPKSACLFASCEHKLWAQVHFRPG